VIDAAPAHQPWHQPLVRRPSLSAPAVRRIAGFVAAALLDELAPRSDTERYVRQRVRERLKEDNAASADDAAARADAAFETNKLDDDLVVSAAQDDDRAFVAHALTLKSGVAADVVQEILGARSNRALVALCWRSNLAMRTAVGLQRNPFGLKGTDVLSPRGGTDYPMTEEEMTWFVAYFEPSK